MEDSERDRASISGIEEQGRRSLSEEKIYLFGLILEPYEKEFPAKPPITSFVWSKGQSDRALIGLLPSHSPTHKIFFW